MSLQFTFSVIFLAQLLLLKIVDCKSEWDKETFNENQEQENLHTLTFNNTEQRPEKTEGLNTQG